MPNPNIDQRTRSPERSNTKTIKTDLQSLLFEGVKGELKNTTGVIDPITFNTLKYPDIYSSIRKRMQHLRDTTDLVDVSDVDIQTIEDIDILKNIEKFARPLKNARRNLYLNIRRNFPNINEKIPNFNEKTLFQKIKSFDENEINGFFAKDRSTRDFLLRYFGISRENLQFRDQDFMKVFGTDNLKRLNPDLYSRTEHAAIAYKNHSITPHLSLIRELVGFYGTADKAKKKEICDFFNIFVSIPDGLKSGLMMENEIEAIAEGEYEGIWNNLSKEAKNAIVQILRYDDNVYVDLGSYDVEIINNYFDTEKMQDIIGRSIHQDLEKNKVSVETGTSVIHDIVPEMDETGTARIHTGFLKKIKDSIQSKNGIPKVLNVENFVAGSVLVFQDEAEKTQYFRLEATDIDIGEYEYGVTLSNITGKENGTVGVVKSTDNIDYTILYNFLQRVESGRVLTHQEFIERQTSEASDHGIGKDHILGEDKILDISESEDIMTLPGFTREINLLDPEGEKIGLSKGVAFISKGKLENGKEYEGVWKVVDISGSTISISNTKYVEKVSFDEFLAVAKKQGLRRIAKVETQSDFLAALQSGDFGIDPHAEFHGHELIIDDHHGHDDYSHDDHGHHAHAKQNNKYEFFRSKSGGHIRINAFSDGLVSFGEYKSPTALLQVQKLGNANKLSEKQKKGLYQNTQMTYGEFLNYLKKNDLKATTDNILAPEASDTYHPHDPHLENSLFSQMGRYWSISDIMKGFGNLTHGIEHYFEKSSKLNASRFALSIGKTLGLPPDIMAQLQADEVTSVKEIIEKIGEKLRNLNGPIGRKKALHIAHTKTARPEEVGAAILHMVKGYGSLYAEDIAYAQGSESFINGLLNACGFRGQALTDMKKKAREKSKVLLGNESGSDLSEEEMIWGFMKMMDGNHEKYPIAATLVKAMGGPSGFENAWRKDGFDGAYEKGVRQAGDLVNAEARVDHGLSALSTHEYHTAIGSMEQAAAKTPDPSIQALPVVWALGGYSKYLSTKANQKIKGYADGKGHSLHAFSFLRTRLDNDLYRYTFREALKTVAPHEVANMDKWIGDLEYDGHSPEKMDKIKPAINGLAGIWRNYHNKGLHDMLQGKNMWLTEHANKDPKIKDYFKKLSEVHQNNSGDEAHGDDNGWYIQHGYVGSPIVKAVDREGLIVNSMERVLRKIKLDSHQLRIDKNHKERYWDPMVKIVKNLNRSSQDERIKAAQFLQYREDILLRFNEAFSSRGEKFADLKKQEFYGELLDIGIDISVIFEAGGNIKQKIEKTAAKDLEAWKQGGHRGGSVSDGEVQSVRSTIHSVISPRQDTGFQGPRARQLPERDPEFNLDEIGGGAPGLHDLSDGSGPD